MSILIKNGRIWDGEKFFFADLLTEEKKIAKIEPEINGNFDSVFDAEGKTVSPGLVDIHVHMKGISGDEFGINAEMCTLPFGVTAAADGSGIYGNKALLDSLSVKNAVFVPVEIKDNKADFENTLKMLEKYKDKAIGIKVYFDIYTSGISDITPLKEAVRFAAERELIVMVHSSNTPVSMSALSDALRPGDIITHAYHGGKNNVSDDGYECIKNAKARGVIIDAGMAGHIHTDFKVYKGAIECGAQPDVISTDITRLSAYKRGGRYGITMCMSIARHLGMEESDIFRAVTSSAAKALGKGCDWGRLEVGRVADICVLEYSDDVFELADRAGNIVKSNEGYRNILTVSDGEIVYKR